MSRITNLAIAIVIESNCQYKYIEKIIKEWMYYEFYIVAIFKDHQRHLKLYITPSKTKTVVN